MTQEKWYKTPMRIAALQCDYENGGNLRVIDKWAEMGFNVEQLKHIIDIGANIHGDFSPEDHGEILHKYIERAQKHDIRIILYLNVHVFPPHDSRAEECAQRRINGGLYLNYNTYTCVCTRSHWREYFLKSVDSLKDFEIDGIFLDGPMIIPGGCFCKTCRAEFQEEYGKKIEDADQEILWRFNAASISLFMHGAYERFKKVKPDGVFYNNVPAMHPTASYINLKDALEYNDILGTEGGFFGLSKSSYNWKPSVTVKVLEALAPDKPRVNFMAGNHYPLSWYMHSAAETKLCIASSVAHDCNVWYGLHGSTELLKTPGGQAAKEMFRALAANEKYYAGSESLATTAVMYSFNTERVYKATIEATDLYGKAMETGDFSGDFSKAFMGVCDMLIRSQISFDVVTDLDLKLDKLKRYGCVILPTSACLSDADIELIRQYVAEGGNIISSFDTSLYTPEGKQRKNFALSDVFGIKFSGTYTDYKTWNYFTATSENWLFSGVKSPLIPAAQTGIDINVSGGEVLARFLGALKGRYDVLQKPDKAAIVLNKYGKGKSLYLAGTFAEHFYNYNYEEHKTIVANAVRSFSHAPVKLSGVNGNVEIVVRKQENRLLVHLINYTGPFPRPLESIIPQTNFELIVAGHKIKSARTLFSDEKLSCQNGKIKIPVLNEYEVIVVENT